MKTLTEEFMNYRECLRVTWNMFLRQIDDGEYEFSDVDRALFSALVLSQCEGPGEPQRLGNEKYYDFLEVRATEDYSELRILSSRDTESARIWTERKIPDRDVDLRYWSIFDFVTFDGCFRDFRYIYTVVVDSRVSDIVAGEALLLEVYQVEIIDHSGNP